MAENSFDIVSKVDLQEVSNAIQNALKEIHTRFDLKNSKSDIQLEGKEAMVLSSADECKLKAVNDILQGKLYLSQRTTERMVHLALGSKSHQGSSPIERLTDREIEIFQMIGQGLTSRQIASKLGLSPKTVDAHRERIKQRLELKNVTELTKHAVQWALENH